MARLDQWLEDGGARAALLGPSGRGKSALLGAWALELARAGRYEIAFIPVCRRFGTAMEHTTLNLLYARVAPFLRSPRRTGERPHGVEETRRDLAIMLAEGRPPDDRPLVVILDGIDEAVTWTPDAAQSFLRDLGTGVRVVLSARSLEALGGLREETEVVALPPMGADEVAEAFRRRLGDLQASVNDDVARVSGGEPLLVEALLEALSQDPAAVVSALAIAPVGASGVLDLCAGGAILPALPWLAGALGPIEGGELFALSMVSSGAWNELSGPLVAAGEPGLALRHFAWAEATLERLAPHQRAAVDRRFADHGKRAFASGTVSEYVCRNWRAHLERVDASLAERLELVSSAWLDMWRMRPDGSSGFLADVEATVACAASLLNDIAVGGDVVVALTARVRCLLVASSVRTILGFEEARRALAAQDEEEEEDGEGREGAAGQRIEMPRVGEDVLDAGRPIADAGERTGALIRLARELPDAERAVVLGWALEAAREEHAGGAALAAAAHALDGQARVTTAREAAARLGRERTEESRIARMSLAALLPEAEALDLGRDAFAEVPADARCDELPRLSEGAARLPASVVRGLWAWSQALPPSERHLVLARLAAGLPAAEREAGASEALGIALSLLADDALPADACWSVCALAPYAPAGAVPALVQACAAAAGCQRPMVTAVAARLCDLGSADNALALVATLPEASDRIEAQAALLAHLPAAVREAAWAELSNDLRANDGARTRFERNAAAWTRALGADAVLDLSREIGATWRALVAIAEASPDHAPAITRDLVERALDRPSDEDEALFALVPLAASMTEPHARRLCQRLLQYLDWKRRPDLLDDWTKDDLGHLAPLFARIAGPRGVAEVAREIVDVARWLP
ncbi:NACHT domain-containing protein [Sorangium sp. So ce134]